jgi:hypothetical protein
MDRMKKFFIFIPAIYGLITSYSYAFSDFSQFKNGFDLYGYDYESLDLGTVNCDSNIEPAIATASFSSLKMLNNIAYKVNCDNFKDPSKYCDCIADISVNDKLNDTTATKIVSFIKEESLKQDLIDFSQEFLEHEKLAFWQQNSDASNEISDLGSAAVCSSAKSLVESQSERCGLDTIERFENLHIENDQLCEKETECERSYFAKEKIGGNGYGVHLDRLARGNDSNTSLTQGLLNRASAMFNSTQLKTVNTRSIEIIGTHFYKYFQELEANTGLAAAGNSFNGNNLIFKKKAFMEIMRSVPYIDKEKIKTMDGAATYKSMLNGYKRHIKKYFSEKNPTKSWKDITQKDFNKTLANFMNEELIKKTQSSCSQLQRNFRLLCSRANRNVNEVSIDIDDEKNLKLLRNKYLTEVSNLDLKNSSKHSFDQFLCMRTKEDPERFALASTIEAVQSLNPPFNQDAPYYLRNDSTFLKTLSEKSNFNRLSEIIMAEKENREIAVVPTECERTSDQSYSRGADGRAYSIQMNTPCRAAPVSAKSSNLSFSIKSAWSINQKRRGAMPLGELTPPIPRERPTDIEVQKSAQAVVTEVSTLNEPKDQRVKDPIKTGLARTDLGIIDGISKVDLNQGNTSFNIGPEKDRKFAVRPSRVISPSNKQENSTLSPQELAKRERPTRISVTREAITPNARPAEDITSRSIQSEIKSIGQEIEITKLQSELARLRKRNSPSQELTTTNFNPAVDSPVAVDNIAEGENNAGITIKPQVTTSTPIVRQGIDSPQADFSAIQSNRDIEQGADVINQARTSGQGSIALPQRGTSISNRAMASRANNFNLSRATSGGSFDYTGETPLDEIAQSTLAEMYLEYADEVIRSLDENGDYTYKKIERDQLTGLLSLVTVDITKNPLLSITPTKQVVEESVLSDARFHVDLFNATIDAGLK